MESGSINSEICARHLANSPAAHGIFIRSLRSMIAGDAISQKTPLIADH
jgi:hypothetical protein